MTTAAWRRADPVWSGAVALTNCRAMLAVDDMAATIRYWTEVLGFTVTAQVPEDTDGPPGWCNLSRDGVSIMFTWEPEHSHEDGSTHRSEAGLEGSLYFNTDDVDALWRELTAKEETGPIAAPANQPHGMREIHLEDPNGFHILFGQPL